MDLPPLEADDLQLVVSLLARLATSSDPIGARKRQLAEGLANLIAADVWLWGQGHGDTPLAPPAGDAPALFGGGRGPGQKALLLRTLRHPDWLKLCRRGLLRASDEDQVHAVVALATRRIPHANGIAQPRRHVTRIRRDLIRDVDWYDSSYYLTRHAPAGVGDFVLSAYPLCGAEWSTLAFWRRTAAAPFRPRDRHVVHLVTANVDGLHRLPNELVPANGEVVHLSPRQHQVLQLLLVGEGNKSIAQKLRISEHTVCDYVKALHRQFKVSSRSQLLARFVGAG